MTFRAVQVAPVEVEHHPFGAGRTYGTVAVAAFRQSTFRPTISTAFVAPLAAVLPAGVH